MTARPGSGMFTRVLRRDSDGTLYDLEEHRPVSIEELRGDLGSGRHFRAHRHDLGADCTYEVLVEVLAAALPAWTLPAKGDLETVMDGLWKGLFLDEQPKGLWGKGWYGRAEDTPQSRRALGSNLQTVRQRDSAKHRPVPSAGWYR